MKDRGVKQAGFWVMVGAAMPCVLVETGFITNSYDAKILRTKAHQQRIAEGIFAGLTRFKKDYENSI
jgi:N-acetylmuramoyl-L-alanine amidase